MRLWSTLWLVPAMALGCGGGGSTECGATPGSICTLAGNGQSALHGNGGPATAASLYTPQDSAVAPDGSVWILDFNDYLIRAVDSKGIINTVVGSGLLGDSPRDQDELQCPVLEAKFNHTPNLFFDGNYLYPRGLAQQRREARPPRHDGGRGLRRHLEAHAVHG